MDCCRWLQDRKGVVLRPNPEFLLFVLSEFQLSQSTELQTASTEGLE